MVLARLLNMLAMLIVPRLDGHLLMLAALVRQLRGAADRRRAAGRARLDGAGWPRGGQVFAGGLMLALPLVAALLTLNLAMGILNRASPQFSIFAVGFPVTLLAGMLLLQLLMPQLAAFLEPRFAAAFETALRVLQALRPN